MNPLELFLKPDWPAPKNVYAATTLRTGGFSQGAFASLNMALHVGDDPELVRKNRDLVGSTLNFPSEPVWLNQVHSNIAVEVKTGMARPEADASFIDQPGVVCAVMTADCLPLLVCTREGDKIAAIHGGWRGLLNGIISNTIKMLQTKDVLVWLGPAIGAKEFEVGAEVRQLFVEKSEAYSKAFEAKDMDKWLADIYQLARIELASLEITDIYGGGHCTVTDHEHYFSYRRDGQTGRMASFIWRD